MEELKKNLIKNNFDWSYAKNREEVLSILEKAIGSEESIGFGGSMTLEELGLYDFFTQRGNPVAWHWKGSTWEEADDTDIYMCSANAVSKKGEFYFVDGNGNRLRNLIYPKKIFLICGTNKIVEDDEACIKRVETQAAPPNGRRLGLSTPCTITDTCHDCSSEDRMCTYYLWIRKNRFKNIHPIFIEGRYGY